MGFDKDELESQGHIINYMIDPVGSAELVKAPKLTRDGAEVTFGVIPQTGYKITEVTANGVELEETDPENIASPSNAERADEAVYYTIPEVFFRGSGSRDLLRGDRTGYTSGIQPG